MKTRLPMWSGIVAVASLTVVDGALGQMNVFNKVRGQVKRVETINNLRQIGQLMEAYRGEHDGKMPKKLKDLAEGQEASLFVYPQDRTPPTKDGLKSSYKYVGPLSSKTKADTIVIYDRKAFNHGRMGRYCLFFDGSVKLLGEGEFKKMYKAQKSRRRRRR